MSSGFGNVIASMSNFTWKGACDDRTRGARCEYCERYEGEGACDVREEGVHDANILERGSFHGAKCQGEYDRGT
jgi:hypothetical protein